MTLLVENYRLDAVIGIRQDEQSRPQPLIIDLEIDYHYSHASQYLDYMEILKVVHDKFSAKSYTLLEEALEEISLWLKQCFPSITSMTMGIKKPQACQYALVGARLYKTFE
ncbi:dihydroneopterin aldolase [Helicobacter baculiformis]|uniref:Dihydroneopterin aldolase n=1 Tax=Helicobacter baculiformis TaxID=427351 RepID=A0ABV7ZLM8_9HELI|nr:dihydroneopterin aldolase [Helicobacter baculiformis]